MYLSIQEKHPVEPHKTIRISKPLPPVEETTETGGINRFTWSRIIGVGTLLIETKGGSTQETPLNIDSKPVISQSLSSRIEQTF